MMGGETAVSFGRAGRLRLAISLEEANLSQAG